MGRGQLVEVTSPCTASRTRHAAVLAFAVALLPLPHGHGWASAAELTWMRSLGEHACNVSSPPTERLLPAYRLAREGCTTDNAARITRARDRALVGYQRSLPRSHGDLSRHYSYTNTDFSQVATAIARRRVDAHCWAILDWNELNDEVGALSGRGLEFRASGFAGIGAASIELESNVCLTLSLMQLKAYANDYRSYALAFGYAVDVLTHEATHARGIDNEAVTECYAIQLVAETTVRLGLSAKTGRIFANALWRHYGNEPKGYATPRCHDAGPLDLHPRTTVWP